MSEIKKIKVFGELPFVILVENGFDVNLKIEEDKGFLVSVDGISVKIYFKKEIRRQSGGVQIASEDFAGKLTFSCFLITPEEDSEEEFTDKLFKTGAVDPGTAINFIFHFIQEFILGYRWATNKHWMKLLAPQSISPINFFWEYEGKEKTFLLGNGGTGVMIGSTITDSEKNKIHTYLSGDSRPDFTYEIMMEANRCKQIHDFTNFCVYIHVYYDSWVSREVKLRLVKLGFTEKQIIEIMERGNGEAKSTGKLLNRFFGKKKFSEIRKDNSDGYSAFSTIESYRDAFIHRNIHPEIDEQEAESLLTRSVQFRDVLLIELLKYTPTI